MSLFWWRSQQGSALLLVIVLSGFLLVSFIAFSGTVRQAIKAQTTSYVDDSIQLDQFRESFLTTGTGTLPKGYFLDTNGPIRYGSITVFSGSTDRMVWSQSWVLNMRRTIGAPFCYNGIDGASIVSGCISNSGSVIMWANTGTLVFSTLGWYSGISISPTTSVYASGAIFQILQEAGNITFFEKNLMQ